MKTMRTVRFSGLVGRYSRRNVRRLFAWARG
jgi:hypothetical protein